MPEELCVCEEPGFFNAGYKGILAHVVLGHYEYYCISSKHKASRCDACQIYPDDISARKALKRNLAKEQRISEGLLSGKLFKDAPLYVNHPRLKPFAEKALRGV